MAFSGFFEDVTSIRNATIPRVVVRSTDVGYVVKTETPLGDRAVLIERVSAIAGMALVVLAVAGLYAGRAYQIEGLGTGPMVAGAVLLTGGIAYLWISARGMRHQANFDLEARKLDYVVRNRLDGFRVLRSVSFDEIEAAFVKRPARPGQPAVLYVRIGAGEDLIEVARGSEDELHRL
ncbi:MAG: hypothetical protein R3D80_21805, partial [Paracoccaceae bacterium]